MRVTEEQVLSRMRKICLTLSGTEEIRTYGHPGFKAQGRIYAVLEEYKGDLSIVVKVGTGTQDLFLADSRFYLTPYIGRQGWVSLKVHAAPVDWREIRELLTGSYQLAAPVRKGAATKRLS